MNEAFAPSFEPTLAAAQARIAAVRPAAYARTRNALDGAVSQLSPYITHGFVTLADVLAGVSRRHALDMQHKFVHELGWRAYFRHVWRHRDAGILQSLHEGLLPDAAYARQLPGVGGVGQQTFVQRLQDARVAVPPDMAEVGAPAELVDKLVLHVQRMAP